MFLFFTQAIGVYNFHLPEVTFLNFLGQWEPCLITVKMHA